MENEKDTKFREQGRDTPVPARGEIVTAAPLRSSSGDCQEPVPVMEYQYRVMQLEILIKLQTLSKGVKQLAGLQLVRSRASFWNFNDKNTIAQFETENQMQDQSGSQSSLHSNNEKSEENLDHNPKKRKIIPSIQN